VTEGSASLIGVTVGIIAFRDYALLQKCLQRVRDQTASIERVIVVDNCPDGSKVQEIMQAFPTVCYLSQPERRGFARSANLVIEGAAPGNAVLIMNADVFLEPDFLEKLLAFDRDPRAGILGGRLEREDGSIDTVGIRLGKNGRAHDMRPLASEVSREPFRVFAVCGAAIFLRPAFLEEVKARHGEWFDASFFQYHEDLDIGWRAQWLGWSCWTVPGAQGVHLRGWKTEASKEIPTFIRRHAFKNQYLVFLKNAPVSLLLRDAIWLLARELLRIGYSIVADRGVLVGYLWAVRLFPRAWRKRQRIQRSRRIDSAAIRSWIR